jgi:hypothetical protein
MIIISPSAAITAVTTWITLVAGRSKRILSEIKGAKESRCGWRKVAPDGRKTGKVRAQERGAIAVLLPQRSLDEATRVAGIQEGDLQRTQHCRAV